MAVIRRIIYGAGAWLFVFALALVLARETGAEYLFIVPIAAPFFYLWLAKRCLRKKKPDWGSEGLKAGTTWVMVAAVLDLLILPSIGAGAYDTFLADIYPYINYVELMIAPWFVDKLMTSLRMI